MCPLKFGILELSETNSGSRNPGAGSCSLGTDQDPSSRSGMYQTATEQDKNPVCDDGNKQKLKEDSTG